LKKSWKQAASAVLIASLLWSAPGGAAAEAAQEQLTAPAEQPSKHQLTESLNVELKSAVVDKNNGSTRIALVIRMNNQGTKLTRVPEYELRVSTNEGVEYTLVPSELNARSIQPKDTEDLSYMLTLEPRDGLQLEEIRFVDIDIYVYPQLETVQLAMPVAAAAASGEAEMQGTGPITKWGEALRLPESPSISFTPVSLLNDFAADGAPTAVLKLLVHNEAKQMETVPEFVLEGWDAEQAFEGKRIEAVPPTLQPGEKTYLHYAIPVRMDTTLKELRLATVQKFVQKDLNGQPETISYSVKQGTILLPQAGRVLERMSMEYQNGTAIQFDPMNALIHPQLDVALVDLHLHENEGDGYQTSLAKFKLTNKSDRPLPVPLFQTELASSEGYSYAGIRQSSSVSQLMPGTSYVFTYSFAIPSSEKGDDLVLRLFDAKTAAPFKTTIAAIPVQVNPLSDSGLLDFYPFTVKVENYTVSPVLYMTPNITYTYYLKLGLDIKRKEQVVVDENFSKMKIELVDSLGKVLGAKYLKFIGVDRLVTGQQTIKFENLTTEQLDNSISVRIYEAMDTGSGEAKRFITELKP
jgi:hypothetical protein